ncbi:hypothetical protein [Psychroflexus aestuariivivens]|uniref:hypothetical protein n=1 Tax=Psychroflexus aestuariivivens TaxID=1795040 RepID=UPI000FDAA666|nr:hypothetical protein [Psychroflexus aestuariivivens]
MKFKPELSVISIVFWLLIIVAFFLIIFYSNLSHYFVGFIPFWFLILSLSRKTITYKVSDEELNIDSPFIHTKVRFCAIKSFKVKTSSFLKQLIIGYPKKYLIIEYNNYDSIDVLNTDTSLLNSLEKSQKN